MHGRVCKYTVSVHVCTLFHVCSERYITYLEGIPLHCCQVYILRGSMDVTCVWEWVVHALVCMTCTCMYTC